MRSAVGILALVEWLGPVGAVVTEARKLLAGDARERWTIFEIDPVMVDIARDPEKFTFLSDCAGDTPIVIGDARLKIAEQPAARFDVLVIDAFSSDAIPLHLLTKEAIGIYQRALKPDGILLIHISNRFFGLEPVLAEEARARGWRVERW